MELTWEEMKARRDLIGGNVVTNVWGGHHEGRFRLAEEVGENILIQVEWWAIEQPPGSGRYRLWIPKSLHIPSRFKPFCFEEGCVTVRMLGDYFVSFYPRGRRKLTSAQVEGLGAPYRL